MDYDTWFKNLPIEGRKKVEEIRSLVQGDKTIWEKGSKRVLKAKIGGGKVVAVNVKSFYMFRRSAAAMMQYAHDNGILAPRVLGCWDVGLQRTVMGPHNTVMVTDRVPGQSLEKIWHSLNALQKENIEVQLRQQIRKMRELTQPYIGRIGNEMTSDVFDCTGFKRDMGPFASEELFDAWSLKKVRCPISRVFWEGCLPSMREDKEPPRFVLTHGNLVADNIMVQDGQITGIVG
ncbi:hypothetical protein AbraIFM66950_002719 [Aspergillus brasiliensis]|nr:hypothetical protein AbraIFM66950_002719 [Aspergillus brasiliensis]